MKRANVSLYWFRTEQWFARKGKGTWHIGYYAHLCQECAQSYKYAQWVGSDAHARCVICGASDAVIHQAKERGRA